MPYGKRRYWQSSIRIGHSKYGKFDCIELQIYQCTQFLDGILKVFIVILLNQHINWFGHCSGENDQVTLGSSHAYKSFTDSVDIVAKETGHLLCLCRVFSGDLGGGPAPLPKAYI
jgi:hypothetical protein